ncbi:MAG: M28 family peptidase [Planctomycetota bacterium]
MKSLRWDEHRVVSQIEEPNVVAFLPGVGTEERPELAEEVIVISAHYDHIGISRRAPEGQDRINNGADDDASGVAVLLELADGFVHGPKPARSVLFLLACAEEKGVLGTEYFAEHPPVPLERIVCNLNLEMLGRPDDLAGGVGKVWLTGYERSTLGPALIGRGIELVADPRPEQSFFTRSDNIVFVRKGVVGQTLSSYNMHTDYHRVSDEIKTIHFEHLTKAAQVCLAAAQELASGRVDAKWLEGEPKLR